VAIRRFEGEAEERAARLAAATGLTMLEARQRTRGPGPRVVSTYGDPSEAALAEAALEVAGFAPLLIRDADLEKDAARVVARSVRLDATRLEVRTRDGRVAEAPLAAITLLLRGTAFSSGTETKVTKEKKLSVGKAMLTGGLLFTKTVEKKTTREVHEREAFLHVYTAGQAPIALRESALQHEAGGARPLEPSRAANFARLAAELRAAAPAAPWDERLLTRAGQLHLLGGVLDPEQFLDVALTVLVASYRA